MQQGYGQVGTGRNRDTDVKEWDATGIEREWMQQGCRRKGMQQGYRREGMGRNRDMDGKGRDVTGIRNRGG